ncbi:hypothetical protein [Erythrobacter sp. SG61-1L]|uniref:hypothetical protein n=1 Tax=Erythrobacter sp. SG61-1L TaxID=1603897 RepID=UPI0012E2DC0D|nr:hypothetical protein [Erythrobacter sp. SG61-1L]
MADIDKQYDESDLLSNDNIEKRYFTYRFAEIRRFAAVSRGRLGAILRCSV